MKKTPTWTTCTRSVHTWPRDIPQFHPPHPPPPYYPVDVVTWINPRCYFCVLLFLFVSILVSVQFCVASLLIRRTHRPFRGFKGALIVWRWYVKDRTPPWNKKDNAPPSYVLDRFFVFCFFWARRAIWRDARKARCFFPWGGISFPENLVRIWYANVFFITAPKPSRPAKQNFKMRNLYLGAPNKIKVDTKPIGWMKIRTHGCDRPRLRVLRP